MSNTTYTHGYALLIGVDQNGVPGWALPDVANDVAGLHGVLVHPERCAYDGDHVKVLTGPDATRGNILAGFDWLQTCVAQDPDATVVVYYSGHGWRDTQSQPPQYYFIPYDVRRARLRSTALRADEFAEAVDSLQPPRLFVVLDCCHAGGMQVKDLGAQYAPAAAPLDILAAPAGLAAKDIGAKGLEPLGAGAGRAVLTSSRGDQQSYVSRKGKMSIFTYHLIAALTGSAQPMAGAQEVLVSDVLGYVYRRVPEAARQEAGAEQQPDGLLTGNFAVALLLGGKGLAAGQTPPDPLAALPAQGTQGPAAAGISIGKIQAMNVGETQFIDQRNATITVGEREEVDTGGGAYVRGGVHTGGGAFVGRDYVAGDQVTGDKITVGDVGGTGVAIGRQARAAVQTGISGDELARALAPVVEAIKTASADAAAQAAGQQLVAELQQELAKGKAADDKRVASILDGLANLVPGAVAAIVGAFGTPRLAGVAGPVTEFALGQLKRRQLTAG